MVKRMEPNNFMGKFPRIMIVGTGSGCGKTTVTCAILKLLSDQKIATASFKCGPDYIDPMFHSQLIGTESRNLDIWLCGERSTVYLFAKTASKFQFSLIEGVMGMYDGVPLESETASSNHLAMITSTPEILVVDVKGLGLSLAAYVHGYQTFHPNRIRAVILNRCSSGMFEKYRELLWNQCKIPVMGYLPDLPEIKLESRHLGLVTANEISDLKQRLELLAETAKNTINLQELLQLGNSAATLSYSDMWKDVIAGSSVRIGVAKDQAFSFIYQDNLELLERLGAEICFFSPLKDKELPQNISGLLLYGGYPEEYLQQLSNNRLMCEAVQHAVMVEKMPTIAECGGFLYLLDQLTNRQGQTYPLVGALHGNGKMTKRLCRFGYAEITAKRDNLLCKKGQSIPIHEFHYSDSDFNGKDFVAKKGGRNWDCIHADETLFAGYPHVHFGGHPEYAKRFVDACRKYQDRKAEVK